MKFTPLKRYAEYKLEIVQKFKEKYKEYFKERKHTEILQEKMTDKKIVKSNNSHKDISQ